MNDETRPGVEVGWDVTRVHTLFDTDWFWQRVGSVKRRLVTARTAHVGVDSQSRIEEQRPAELDAFSCYRKLRGCHVLGQRLENLLRLFQQRSVLCRGRRKQDREARRDACRIEVKLGHCRLPAVDPRLADQDF